MEPAPRLVFLLSSTLNFHVYAGEAYKAQSPKMTPTLPNGQAVGCEGPEGKCENPVEMELEWPTEHDCRWVCAHETDLSSLCAFSWAYSDDNVSGTSCAQRFVKDTTRQCCECLQSMHNSSSLDAGSPAPCTIPSGSSSLFLVVYHIGSWLGLKAIHTNLAWCRHPDLISVPHRVGRKASRRNKEVRAFLLDYGCREVVWDGRHQQKMWSPSSDGLGLWPPGHKKISCKCRGGLWWIVLHGAHHQDSRRSGASNARVPWS